ncbi:MAG TPA: ATP synthase subunit I [Rubrivivax sp.]
MSHRTLASDPWPYDDERAETAPYKALTRQEAQALRSKEPAVSPWWVVLVQAGVGVVVAALVWLLSGEQAAGLSALYGAAVVVLPGALMARGMTSRLSSMSPGSSAVSFMAWEMVKIGASVGLLMLAPKLVQPLSWPALLVALVLCIKVYWLALLWRKRSK